MPVDPSVSLKTQSVKVPNILQMAGQAYQLRNAKLQGNQLQQVIGANEATSQAVKGATDPNTGQVNYQKAMTLMAQDPRAAYDLPKFAQSVNTMKQQNIGIDKSKLDLAKERTGYVAGRLSSLMNDPGLSKSAVVNSALQMQKTYGIPDNIINGTLSDLRKIPDNPEALKTYLHEHLLAVQDQAKQLEALTPHVDMQTNGQSTFPVNTNPNAGPVGPMAGATGYQQQLPPATPTFNPQTNAPGYLGASGGAPQTFTVGAQPHNPLSAIVSPNAGMPMQSGQQGASPQESSPQAPNQGGFVQSGPALGQTENAQGTVKSVNDSWQRISQAAQGAQTDIGTLNNIKELADKASTGAAADKKALYESIRSLLPIQAGADTKTANDLIHKYIARLDLNGRASAGATDAAGTLAEAANPNANMTPQAIKEASNYLIGLNKMALSEQQYLAPLKGNYQKYQKALTQINQYADPRVWQFLSLSRPEQQAFRANMSKADQASFEKNIKGLVKLGVLR